MKQPRHRTETRTKRLLVSPSHAWHANALWPHTLSQYPPCNAVIKIIHTVYHNTVRTTTQCTNILVQYLLYNDEITVIHTVYYITISTETKRTSTTASARARVKFRRIESRSLCSPRLRRPPSRPVRSFARAPSRALPVGTCASAR